MNRNPQHRNLFRERLTILLVFFFCFLISSSEYIIQDSHAEIKQEQQNTQDESPAEGETYLSSAVDAVVPFVFAAVDHAFHLIYEPEGFKELVSSGLAVLKFTSSFSEILLEKIISTNAP